MEIINKLKEITEPAVGPVMDIVSGIVLDGVAGTIVPGVGNMILSYKQQRTEKNLEMFISQIVARQDEFNEKLNQLEPDKLQKITNHYFGIVTDYVLDVKQKEKINFIVNGYINLPKWETLNEDVVLMYYDTLDQMTLMDIAVLKSHYGLYCSDSANIKMLDELVQGQQRLISEKLLRLGLFMSQNEKKMDSNLNNIALYLQDVQKGKKNLKLKVDRISVFDSFRMTSFGRGFLEFFLNTYSLEDDSEE